MIGIIGAMKCEVSELVKEMTQVQNDGIFTVGRLNGKDVVIAESGIGKVNAAHTATLMVHKYNPELIINTGLAGAMADGMNVFDVVCSSGTVYHDFDIRFFGYKKGQVPNLPEVVPSDEKTVKLVEAAFENVQKAMDMNNKLFIGTIASGDQFISSTEVKKTIKEEFSPVCVDMESGSISHICHISNVPFVAIRLISDKADDSAEDTYSFNEETAGNISANITKHVLKEL